MTIEKNGVVKFKFVSWAGVYIDYAVFKYVFYLYLIFRYECAEVRSVGTQTRLEFPYSGAGTQTESATYVTVKY